MDQMDEMDYGMEMGDGMGEMMGEEMMGYGEEEMDYGEEQSLNFQENPEFSHLPPLDRMRKIRRDIVKSINDMRDAHKSPGIYVDSFSNRAATEYAKYLLSNPEDEAKAKEIAKAHMVDGDVVTLVGFAFLDEDDDHQGPLHDQLMDAHGLLLELEHEMGVLADPKNTHVGIGFAINNEQVRVVEMVTQKPIMINQLNEAEDGGVEARGIVLNKEVGLYAARIASVNKMNKDIKVVGPSNIHYDKKSGNFIIHIPGPVENVFYSNDDLKVIQFYIRRSQVEKIQYGQESNERINVAHLELCMTLPMEFIPDPRTVIEDAADVEREAKDRELRKRKEEEEAAAREAERAARQAEREKQKQALIEQRELNQDEMSVEGSAMSQSKKSRATKT